VRWNQVAAAGRSFSEANLLVRGSGVNSTSLVQYENLRMWISGALSDAEISGELKQSPATLDFQGLSCHWRKAVARISTRHAQEMQSRRSREAHAKGNRANPVQPEVISICAVNDYLSRRRIYGYRSGLWNEGGWRKREISIDVWRQGFLFLFPGLRK
jgi:hypothetical protein